MSTSYSPRQLALIKAIVREMHPRPQLAVELGVQTGDSMLAIGHAMTSGHLIGIDSFSTKYSLPPHGETHASIEEARSTVAALDGYDSNKTTWEILQGDAADPIWDDEFKPKQIDFLHIDICNCKENLTPILGSWLDRVSDSGLVILEGGRYNRWQQEHGFSTYEYMLWRYVDWDFFYMPFDDNHGITLMRRSNV